jgi:copper chaperone CopZ
MTTKITLKGLHCPACKKLTEKRISSIVGVTSVNVNSDTGITEIVADNLIQKSQVEAVLPDTGYSVA